MALARLCTTLVWPRYRAYHTGSTYRFGGRAGAVVIITAKRRFCLRLMRAVPCLCSREWSCVYLIPVTPRTGMFTLGFERQCQEGVLHIGKESVGKPEFAQLIARRRVSAGEAPRNSRAVSPPESRARVFLSPLSLTRQCCRYAFCPGVNNGRRQD